MIILLILVLIVAASFCVMGLVVIIEGDGSGILAIALGLIVSFIGIYGFPIKENKTIFSNVPNYFQITPYKDGYMVVNLRDKTAREEFDVRFIEAYKNNKLFVEQKVGVNVLGESVYVSNFLKFNENEH